MATATILIILLIAISILYDQSNATRNDEHVTGGKSEQGKTPVKGVLNVVKKGFDKCVTAVCNAFGVDIEWNRKGKNGTWKNHWSPKGYRIAAYAIQGPLPYMEDRFSVVDNDHSIGFAVYDGHGGWKTAAYATRNLLPNILEALQKNEELEEGHGRENPKQVIIEQFLALDKKVMEKDPKSGSTAVVGVVYQNKLYIANVGDSRAVARYENRDVEALTTDHNLNVEEERTRIEDNKGTIKNDSYVVVGEKWLGMTRSLGDAPFKKYGVTARPEMKEIDLTTTTIEYIILASDGVWDVIDNEHAVGAVYRYVNDATLGSDKLVTRASETKRLNRQWRRPYHDDNITVMVVKLPVHTVDSSSH